MSYQVRVFQHVAFEGPGTVQPLLEDLGLACRTTHLYAGEQPHIQPDDNALIVLGGPMSVSDVALYPWLATEQALITSLLAQGFPILGICLGAQMMAQALGARVWPMDSREIGWHPVTTDPAISQTWMDDIFGAQFTALHWHGDQFELPPGAIPIGASPACACQGFLQQPGQLGLQFHLEFDRSSIKRLVKNSADELDASRWVQSPQEMLDKRDAFSDCRLRMKRLMEAWIGTFD